MENIEGTVASRFDYVLDGFTVGKETVVEVDGPSIDPSIDPNILAAADSLTQNMIKSVNEEVAKAQVEYHTPEVPAILPAHSGTTLKVLKELVDNPEIVAKLAEQGLMVDYEAIAAFTHYDGVELEGSVCACDTCLEGAGAGLKIEESDNVPCDTDADGLQMALEMIFELQQKFEALEARIRTISAARSGRNWKSLT